MKKILSFSISIALLALGFVACNDDDKEVLGLEIIKSDVEFASTGGQGTIELSAPSAVTAKSDKEWLTIDTQTQSAVTFTVAGNGDMMNRTATITITAGGQTTTVPVTQAGAIFSTEEIEQTKFPARGSTYSIELYSNTNLDVSVDESWAEVSYNDGILTLTLENNIAGTDRSATVTVKGSWKEETFTISQNRITLFDDGEYVTLPYSGTRTNTITLGGERDMLPDDWTVSVSDSWATAQRVGDSYEIVVTPTAQNTTGANRTTNLVVAAGGVTIEEPVIIQARRHISLEFANTLASDCYFDIHASTGDYHDAFTLLLAQAEEAGRPLIEMSFFANAGTYGTHALYFGFDNDVEPYAFFSYNVQYSSADEFLAYLAFGGGAGGSYQSYMSLTPAMFDDIVNDVINRILTIVEVDQYINPTWIKFADSDDPSSTFVLTAEPITY